MSKFKRVEDSLRELDGRNNLALEDVLGVFLDLCQDCGVPMERMEVQDEEKLLAHVSRTGRTVLNILKTKESLLQSVDFSGKVEKQKDRIQAGIADLEQKEALQKQELTKLAELEAVEQAKILEWKAREQEIQENNRKLEELQITCQRLEQQVQGLKGASLEEVQQRQQELLQQKKDAQQQLDMARSQENSMREELQQAKAQLQEQKETVEKLNASSKEILDDRAKQEQEKQRLLKKNAEDTARLQQLQQEVKEYQEKQGEAGKQLAEAQEELSQLKTWFESLEVQKQHEQLQLLKGRVQALRRVQNEFLQEIQKYGMNQGMSPKGAEEQKKVLQQRQLQDLETKVEEYQKLYYTVIDFYNSKEWNGGF